MTEIVTAHRFSTLFLVLTLSAAACWNPASAQEHPADHHDGHAHAASSEADREPASHGHGDDHGDEHDHHGHGDEGHGHSLDAVEVVATRVGRSASDEPIRVEVIVREEIEMCGFGFRGIDRASNR